MIQYEYLGGALIMMGTVNFMDGLYSILLYLGKPSWRKNDEPPMLRMSGVHIDKPELAPFPSAEPQTWRKDHWVRAVRMIISVAVILIGWVMI